MRKKDDDEFSEWDEDNENKEDKSKYWFTRDKMDKILKVHDYLELAYQKLEKFYLLDQF